MIGTMENRIFEIHILSGLPASGKTYFATHNFTVNTMYNHNGSFIVDLDAVAHGKELTHGLILEALGKSDLYTYLKDDHLYYEPSYKNHVKMCIDGLILTIEDLHKVIAVVADYITHRTSDYKLVFVIHQWNDDRETCLANDILRSKLSNRELNSQITIRNHRFEHFTKDNIIPDWADSNISDISLKHHTVKKITVYDVAFEPNIGQEYNNQLKCCEKTKYMYSEPWSGGGTWGAYDGTEGTISPEEPVVFKELDDLLEKICPNITYLQYRKIEKACVDVEETREHDYYGGCETCLRWRCDLEVLYNMLKEMNLITEYDIKN